MEIIFGIVLVFIIGKIILAYKQAEELPKEYQKIVIRKRTPRKSNIGFGYKTLSQNIGNNSVAFGRATKKKK